MSTEVFFTIIIIELAVIGIVLAWELRGVRVALDALLLRTSERRAWKGERDA